MSRATGTVQMTDPNGHTLTVHGLVLNKTFQMAEDAVITTRDKPEADLRDLKIGDAVEVAYEEQGAVSLAHRVMDSGPSTRPGAQPQKKAA